MHEAFLGELSMEIALLNFSSDVAAVKNGKLESNAKQIFTKSPKILLIEDTPIVQKVNLTLLTLLGCKVDLAKNGREAIALFNQAYDLVISDIGLPDIDGREVIKIMRQQDSTRKIPIIALTTHDDAIIQECFAAGVDGFYTKPLKQEALKAVLMRWLPQHI